MAMIDIRQTEEYANYIKREGWVVERINRINYFLKKISFLGYILKLQRPSKIDYEVIDRLCRKYRVFHIIIEPKDISFVQKLASNGFKLSKKPYLPTKTLQIDLSRSKEQIFKTFEKHTRQAVKRGEVKNIKILSTPNEIREWQNAWKNSVNFNRYVPSAEQLLNLRKSFPQSKSLFLASHNIFSRIIGGALFTISSHDRSNYISYYWYGFTNKEGRSTLSQYPLLYQGILWAKRMGCKTFDFEGIYDERFPNKSWLGFSRFKKSFGGSEVDYPGCYTKLRFPW